MPWPSPRFETKGETVFDRLTGLTWTRRANHAGFPLDWNEALAFVADMNRRRELGFDDWRLPNRRELRSLVSLQTRKPALPQGHPFTDVFLGWYWTSTTAAISPDHAWYLHLEGARMFYGGKDQAYLVWPVRGPRNHLLPRTGQQRCFDAHGQPIDCTGTGQDGEWLTGTPWPEPRFKTVGDGVLDRLTGLVWWPVGDFTPEPVTWGQALARVRDLNADLDERQWRLPGINELESLVDASQARPALPQSAPFDNLMDVYWSSTTSLFEPDWAWALYLDKGATGVGQKKLPAFHAWPVRDHRPA